MMGSPSTTRLLPQPESGHDLRPRPRVLSPTLSAPTPAPVASVGLILEAEHYTKLKPKSKLAPSLQPLPALVPDTI